MGELAKISTKAGAYEPTAAERKIVEALLNPANANISITELCRRADVNRDTYYQAMKKPEFQSFYHELVIDTLKARVTELINASYKYAMGSAKNHQDRKMLLELAGIYTEKQKVEHSGGEEPIKVLFNIPRPEGSCNNDTD